MSNSQNIPNDPAPLDEEISTDPQTTAVLTPTRVFGAALAVGAAGVLVMITAAALTFSHANANYSAIVKGLNDTGEVKVIDGSIMSKLDSGTVILNRQGNRQGEMFKCEVSIVKNIDVQFTNDVVDKTTMETDTVRVENVAAHVFCPTGGPLTFVIPVPYDPHNIFYVAPDKGK